MHQLQDFVPARGSNWSEAENYTWMYITLQSNSHLSCFLLSGIRVWISTTVTGISLRRFPFQLLQFLLKISRIHTTSGRMHLCFQTDLYTYGTPQPQHRLLLRFFVVFLNTSWQASGWYMKQVTIASVHTLYNLPLINHLALRRCMLAYWQGR